MKMPPKIARSTSTSPIGFAYLTNLLESVSISRFLRAPRVYEPILLMLILSLAAFVAYIPHIDYPYPLHIDEWNNLAHSEAILNAQGAPYQEPFFGEEVVVDNPEIGLHLFLGVLKLATNLSWLQIFRYFPGVVTVFIVLAAYIFGRRHGFGLEAALFTALIPTTVRILGPALLVAASLAIFLLLLMLYTLHHSSLDVRKSLLINLLLLSLFLIHPPTGVAAGIVLAIYFVSGLAQRKDLDLRSKTVLLGATLTVGFATIALLRFDTLFGVAKTLDIPPLPAVQNFPAEYGYLTLAFAAIGVFALGVKGQAKNYAFLLSMLAFVLLIISLPTPSFIPIAALHDRSFMYFALLGSLAAGIGAGELRIHMRKYLALVFPRYGLPSVMLVTLLLLTAATLAVRERWNEPYYRLLDEKAYTDLVWIRNHLDNHPGKVLADPSTSIVIPPLAGRHIYTSNAAIFFVFQTVPDLNSRINEAVKRLSSGNIDTQWLRSNDIGIVYTRGPVSNPDLFKVADSIYVLPP